MKRINLRENKGITLLSLGLTIVVLILITSTLVFNSTNDADVKYLNRLYNDIESLEDKIATYYAKYGNIPANTQYNGLEGKYYILELEMLSGISLNYGKDYDIYQKDSAVNTSTLSDIYVINKDTNYIYYVKGIEVDGVLYHGKDETEEISLKVTTIGSVKEWNDFAARVNSGENFEKQFVTITNNIDFSGQTFTVAGSDTNVFKGEFNGKNYELTGITYNSSSNYVGLFGTNEGTIKNVVLKNMTLTSQGITGGIAGKNTGKITNCEVYADIKSNSQVGGITGINAGTIENCIKNELIQGTTELGGIVGNNTGNILNCTNKGNSTINYTNSHGKIGGIVGINDGKVEKCINLGTVTATGSTSYNSYAGGICGIDGTNSIINMCGNAGIIKGLYYVGGIIGAQNAKISLCYSNADISGNARVGGVTGAIIGQTAGKSIIDTCYNMGNITASESLAGGIIGEVKIPTNTSLKIGNISYCYTIAKVSDVTNSGGILGNTTTNVDILGCYYLNSGAKGGIGGQDVTSSAEGKTTPELKKIIPTLNNYEEDLNDMNRGYPILSWQK